MLPLHWACLAGQNSTAEVLLKNLVNEIAEEDESIMIEDDAFGRTPPMLAASSGNLHCLQVTLLLILMIEKRKLKITSSLFMLKKLLYRDFEEKVNFSHSFFTASQGFNQSLSIPFQIMSCLIFADVDFLWDF